MSSSFYLFCLGHNPATVISELKNPESLPTFEELKEQHPECDFIISRVSGAPVEFACPGFGACPCGGHPNLIRWADADWLRVLVIAHDARSADIQRLRDRRRKILSCWTFDRLNKLRYELGDWLEG